MKTRFVLLQVTAVALLLPLSFGCAPPAPTDVDMSTDIVDDGNMTTGAEAPGSNMTTGVETVSEVPAE